MSHAVFLLNELGTEPNEFDFLCEIAFIPLIWSRNLNNSPYETFTSISIPSHLRIQLKSAQVLILLLL